ncbi:methyltransferase [Duganella sp. Leaf126]|nr:methyltransferase [Duganella sp. Leaf126]
MSNRHSHFQQLYTDDADPWKVRQRWYEQRKRSLLLACLPLQHYRHAFEPACGNGELTAALAQRADAVLATDLSPEAVRLTQQRVRQEEAAAAARVTVRQQVVPQEWPEHTFDLIVISEMAYYLPEHEVGTLRQRCMASLDDHGTLVLCHWRWPFADRQLDSADIHAAFDGTPGMHRLMQHSEADFLLDIWSRNPCSVAQKEGLAP